MESFSAVIASAGGSGADYVRTRWLLQRAIALIYVVAFAGAVNQFVPLLGSHGLTPVPFFLSQVSGWTSPSVFFLRYSDGMALTLAWVGLACAVAALSGVSERFGTPVSIGVWALMWLLYLSFVNVGQTWYAFGWETLLLEAGFLAVFLGGADVVPPVAVIWLFRWLLFRLMFGAGLIKLRGDPCWRDLTCLIYHFQSQPLPNPLSWYFGHLPSWADKAGVVFNHVAELAAPFGYLTPRRRVRYVAGGITIAFQTMLILSGNLSWLNWLTIAIAISCFDDRLLGRLRAVVSLRMPTWHTRAVTGLVGLVVALSVRPAMNLLSAGQIMNGSFEPLHLVNTYGAFGSISRQRLEVVLEGTSDTVVTPTTQWKEYQFKAKPGDVSRMPPLVAPYHLRLDWLMWFAGLDRSYADPWFLPLVARLLQNDGPTLGLMGANPFPGAPPTFIRARLYEYRFTSWAEHRRTGAWWTRTLVSEYLPAVWLREPGLLEMPRSQGWVD